MLQPAVEFRTPAAGDIVGLASTMRAQDVAEVRAAGREDLHEAVAQSVRVSAWCHAVHVDGELACIFGVAPRGTLLNPVGVPWLLGTDLIPKHRRIFARLSRPYIAQMLAAYPHLTNAVHAKNTVAVRWLKAVGFALQPAHAHPATGEPFHVFTMGR